MNATTRFQSLLLMLIIIFRMLALVKGGKYLRPASYSPLDVSKTLMLVSNILNLLAAKRVVFKSTRPAVFLVTIGNTQGNLSAELLGSSANFFVNPVMLNKSYYMISSLKENLGKMEKPATSSKPP